MKNVTLFLIDNNMDIRNFILHQKFENIDKEIYQKSVEINEEINIFFRNKVKLIELEKNKNNYNTVYLFEK